MSSLAIAGDSSGQITLAAPAVSGTTTLTLPATTGTMLNDATVGVCRAWVNYNGVTTTIQASFNISSVTRNGVGDYTINFTNAQTDTKYAWSGSAGFDNVGQTVWVSSPSSVALSTWKTTTSLRLWAVFANTAKNSDEHDFSVMVFR